MYNCDKIIANVKSINCTTDRIAEFILIKKQDVDSIFNYQDKIIADFYDFINLKFQYRNGKPTNQCKEKQKRASKLLKEVMYSELYPQSIEDLQIIFGFTDTAKVIAFFAYSKFFNGNIDKLYEQFEKNKTKAKSRQHTFHTYIPYLNGKIESKKIMFNIHISHIIFNETEYNNIKQYLTDKVYKTIFKKLKVMNHFFCEHFTKFSPYNVIFQSQINHDNFHEIYGKKSYESTTNEAFLNLLSKIDLNDKYQTQMYNQLEMDLGYNYRNDLKQIIFEAIYNIHNVKFIN